MLTQLQRDAMTRAQVGDFSLADAIEVLHPDRANYRGESLLGGVYRGGRLQFLAYGGAPVCDECEGSGVVVCDSCSHESECDECDGAGEDANGARLEHVVNLNGEEDVDIGDTEFELDLTLAQARKVVDDYKRESEPPPADAGQTVLLPEPIAA